MLLDLSTELILHVFHNCTSIADVLNLALVCRRFHALLPTSQRISILFKAAEVEFGPVFDAMQIVTLNQTQAAHVDRSPPLSYSLLRQVISVGRVAQKWEAIYPEIKWKANFVDRRLLRAEEKYKLRRAIYRYWLYSAAFHTSSYPRTMRMFHTAIAERGHLVRKWSTEELLEIEDTRLTLLDFLSSSIVPSDGNVMESVEDHWPRNSTHNFQSRSSFVTRDMWAAEEIFHTFNNRRTRTFINSTLQDPFMEGWGDEITHYYVIQDLMKLDPAQIILLKNTRCKGEVESYLDSLGEWFKNNGETFVHTLHEGLISRGHDLKELLDGVEAENFGVAVKGRGTLPPCWG